MAHKYILDTHALIWFAEGNKRLTEQAKSIMSANESRDEAITAAGVLAVIW